MNEKYYLYSDIQEIVNNLKKYHNKFYGKRFFITGANGFLGKYFIKVINEINKKTNNKIKVLANDIKFDDCEIFKEKNVKIIKKDINNINGTQEVFDHRAKMCTLAAQGKWSENLENS